MPRFLVNKLKAEYPGNPSAVYGTLNRLGAMHGNKETAKGRAMQAKHDAKVGSKAKTSAPAPRMVQGGPVRKMHPNSMKNLTAPKFSAKAKAAKRGGDTESHMYGIR